MAENFFRGFERPPAAHARTAICFDGFVQAGIVCKDDLALLMLLLFPCSECYDTVTVIYDSTLFT